VIFAGVDCALVVACTGVEANFGGMVGAFGLERGYLRGSENIADYMEVSANAMDRMGECEGIAARGMMTQGFAHHMGLGKNSVVQGTMAQDSGTVAKGPADDMKADEGAEG